MKPLLIPIAAVFQGTSQFPKQFSYNTFGCYTCLLKKFIWLFLVIIWLFLVIYLDTFSVFKLVLLSFTAGGR